MILNSDRSDRPLCPNSSNVPAHPAHLAAGYQGDRLYEAAAPWRDDDGEYFNAGVEALMAIAYPEDRMNLYEDSAGAGPNSIRVGVWSYTTRYFRCSICGLTLPATADMRPTQ